MRRPDARLLAALAAVGYAVLATVALGALVLSGIDAAGREEVLDRVGGQLPAAVVGGLVLLAGLGVLVHHQVGRFSTAARRLTAETRLLDANPDHRLEVAGPDEVQDLVRAVEALSERRRTAEREVAAQVATAQAGLEQERNRLAALMAELAVAVVVCNADGRILLYNSAARSVVDDASAVGIGRSVYGVVDRELVDHALARIRAGATSSHVATTVHRGRVLQVRLATVAGPDREAPGFVLLLDDLTERMEAGTGRNDLLQQLAESTRGSLASIRAAVETVLGYPDMEPGERQRFLGVVTDESQRLGDRLERWTAEAAGFLAADWPATDMAGDDLVGLVADAVGRSGAARVVVVPAAELLWVRVDSHALARSAAHLVGHLAESAGVTEVALDLVRNGRHAQLDLSWAGPAVAPDVFAGWVDEPLTGAAPSVREVVGRHGGEAWSGTAADGSAYLRLLLPLSEAGPAEEHPAFARALTADDSRPEFYDFDLFGRQEQTGDWLARPLGELSFTVFDTETTGLDALHGDEVVSIGAVRIVNGRLLRQESFERLVDPQRSVPAASTAVHGLTRAMLRGAPPVETVLREFHRYAEDTVLVGHNVSFDLQFLRLKEQTSGVRLTQPALDTLLLDALVHPDHAEHSLEAIAARLGVEVVGRHSALGDALVTAEVFLRLVRLLEQRGTTTLGEVLETSRTTLQARLDRSRHAR